MTQDFDPNSVPTETHTGLWAKAWKEAQDAHWHKIFKKALKQQKANATIYIRVTGLTERAEVEARGWQFDSIATSLFNARQNSFNMKIDRDLLKLYLKEK